MTVREDLHRLVDRLSESQVEELRRIARGLCEGELDDEPLSDDDLVAIREGEEDFKAGPIVSLTEYINQQRG